VDSPGEAETSANTSLRQRFGKATDTIRLAKRA